MRHWTRTNENPVRYESRNADNLVERLFTMGEDSGGAVELYYMNAFGEKEHLTTVGRLGALMLNDYAIDELLKSRNIILTEVTEDGEMMTLAKVKKELERVRDILKDEPSVVMRYDATAPQRKWREVRTIVERLLKNIREG